MNLKPTLYLAVVVGVLCAFFYFFENKQPTSTEANADAKRLVKVDRDEVSGLTVTDHDLKIDLAQEDNRHWRMKSPVADRADQSVIDQVLTELDTARTDESFKVADSDKSKLQEYGLQTPHERLVVTRKNGAKPVEILFGNDTAIEGKTYARVEGTGQVQITSNEFKKLLQKEVNAWRDHRVVDLAATDVTRLLVKNASGETELQRDGAHWKIAKPLMARGDDAKINDLVSQLTNLGIKKFVADDKADAGTYGLAEPRGVMTLFTADNPKGTELMIGGVPSAAPAGSPTPAADSASPAPTPAAADADSVYMRQPARQSIYTVTKNIENLLALKPNDLRDHALARINADTVDRVHLGPVNLARKDKDWTVNDQPANGAGVTQLVNALDGAQATAFVADSAAPADLAKYGLDQPSVQVKFGAFASENTAETAAGEKPVATVDFGKVEGDNVYARLEEEPFIVSVPKAVLNSVWTDPLQWQPLEIFAADPEKVIQLEIGAKGAPSLPLTRSEKGEWKAAAGGTAVDAAKVQPVLGILAKLHAVRWVGGPMQPTYALDNPQATLTFAGAADDKADAGKLYLGGRTAELMTYARAEGKPGVFLISRPDAETLLSLAPQLPAPSATPTPALPAATPAPEAAPMPATASTPEPIPTVAPMPATTPTPALTPMPEPSAAPTPTATPEPVPSATPEPTPMATATPEPTAAVEPVPSPTVTSAPMHTPPDVPAPGPVP